jgi:hypothetical protein
MADETAETKLRAAQRRVFLAEGRKLAEEDAAHARIAAELDDIRKLASSCYEHARAVGSASFCQLGGFAPDHPTGAMSSSDNSTAHLVQAMAGFGGGSSAGDGLTAMAMGAETSQQTFLTMPQHP